MFTHTHDGVPCQEDGCALDRDKPAWIRSEYLPGVTPIYADTHDPRDDLWSELNRLGEEVADQAARQLGRRDSQPAYRDGVPQRSPIDGTDDPADISIPLRMVVTSEGVMLRCVFVTMLRSGATCNEQWPMHHIGPAEFTEAISHALGHVSIAHRP